jgi:hypothetical protein
LTGDRDLNSFPNKKSWELFAKIVVQAVERKLPHKHSIGKGKWDAYFFGIS